MRRGERPEPPPLELDEALEQLREALEDEGRAEYHHAVMARTEQVWPTLMNAVRNVLAASKRPTK